jgi:hypothetical protein
MNAKTPRAKISTFDPISYPEYKSSCYGDLYKGVVVFSIYSSIYTRFDASILFITCIIKSFTFLEQLPKSQILYYPLELINTFYILMSLCVTPFLCICSRTYATTTRIFIIIFSFNSTP